MKDKKRHSNTQYVSDDEIGFGVTEEIPEKGRRGEAAARADVSVYVVDEGKIAMMTSDLVESEQSQVFDFELDEEIEQVGRKGGLGDVKDITEDDYDYDNEPPCD